MAQELKGCRVAILASDGVEQVELTEPRRALEQAGADTWLVSPRPGSIKAWRHDAWGDPMPVDLSLADANVANFDALLLPGGVMNPDQLRADPRAVAFVRAFTDAGKPVAAICHAPWLLVEAGVVAGRRLTSYPSIRTDITNAGGLWEDSEVVSDGGLITSRSPSDIPAFNRKMIEAFASAAVQR